MASVVSTRSPVVVNSSKIQSDDQSGHYSYLEAFHIEEDSLIESLPSLYFSDTTRKEDTEDVDTEDDDDDSMPSKPIIKDPPPLLNASSCIAKKTPLLSSSFSHSQLNSLAPIQTYLPQLNHSFYSPTSSVVSSIRSKKSSRYNYPLSHHSDNASTCSTPETPSVPTTVTTTPKRLTPLYSIQSTDMEEVCPVTTAPSIITSSSRIKNAFQKFRPAKSTHHPNTNTNSVVPAELASTMKVVSFAKSSSLADKIRHKFQQQLDKTKNRSSLIEVSKTKSTFSSVTRSASLSSLSNWSARLSKSAKKGISSSVTMTNLRNTPLVVSHSVASSLASNDSSLSDENMITPATATTTPFSLKKSMSSHKLYNHKKSSYYGPSSNPESLMSDNLCKKDCVVRFKKMVSVRETFSKSEYDRASDPDAVCTRLTPIIAQQIKDELNTYKLNEMKVHNSSRGHTHFFL